MEWKSEVEFRDLFKDFDSYKNEREEIQRIKSIWIDRFNQYDELKKFIPALKNVKTLKALNRWLNDVYYYCDANRIWVRI